jgi:hypothetical protein
MSDKKENFIWKGNLKGLKELIKKDKAVLEKEYNIENITRETQVKFTCSCGKKDCEKSFRRIKENGGAYCTVCTSKNRIVKLKQTIKIPWEEFKKMMEEVCKDNNGDSFDYSHETNEKSYDDNNFLIIFCNIHGDFNENHSKHLKDGFCPYCKKEKDKKITEEKIPDEKKNKPIRKTSKYNEELLNKTISEFNLTLIEYKNKDKSTDLKRESVIYCKCKCGDDINKSFESLLKNPACKKCINNELSNKIKEAKNVDLSFIDNMIIDKDNLNMNDMSYIRKGEASFELEIKRSDIFEKNVYKNFKNLKDAIIYRDKAVKYIKEKEEEEKQKRIEEKNNLDIVRNKDGIAILYLYNVKGKIPDKECFVDDDRWHEFNQYRWYISNTGYVATDIERKTTHLHKHIMGEYPEDKDVIDHKNGNRLDNRIKNLRFATNSENSQNRNNGKDSIGIRVFKNKNSIKFGAYFKDKHLGSFNTEEEAKRAYDIAVICHYKNSDQRTNYIYTNEQIEYIIKNNTVSDNTEESLPKGITKKEETYIVKLLNKEFRISIKEEFIVLSEALIFHKQEHDKIKELKKNKINSLPIERNKDGIAVLYLYDVKGNKIPDKECLVDDDRWHELRKSGWCLHTGGYATRQLTKDEHKNGKKSIRMHHQVYGEIDEGKDVIDHKNGIRLDNRISNLRAVTYSENSINNKSKREKDKLI